MSSFPVTSVTLIAKIKNLSPGEDSAAWVRFWDTYQGAIRQFAALKGGEANADDIVYLWPQRDGQYRVLGNPMFETNTTPSQESGSAETDASGTTINVAVTDIMPSPFYTGKIETEDGDISGADGSPMAGG